MAHAGYVFVGTLRLRRALSAKPERKQLYQGLRVPWVVQRCLIASSRARQECLSHAALSPYSWTTAGTVHMQILPQRDRPTVARREWLRGGESQVRPAFILTL